MQSYEKKRGVDSSKVDMVNQSQPVNTGSADGFALGDRSGIEVDIVQVMDNKALDYEKFMAEEMMIHMYDPPNEDAHQFAEVTVNGDHRILPCGQEAKVRRYHVAVLANAKAMRIVQKPITNSDGSKGFREDAVLKLMYPFSVTHDPNPKGGPWLRQLLQNPT